MKGRDDLGDIGAILAIDIVNPAVDMLNTGESDFEEGVAAAQK